MNKFKIVLDRAKLTSQEIAERRDFEKVLKGATATKIWYKSPYFYGAIGVTCLVSTVLIMKATSSLDSSPDSDNKLAQIASSEKETGGVLMAANNPKNKEKSVLLENKSATETVQTKPKKQESQLTIQKTDVRKENVANSALPVEKKQTSEGVRKSAPMLPSIAGKFMGDLSLSEFVDAPIIEFQGGEITSFVIQYAEGMETREMSVTGNKIPQKVIETVKKQRGEQMLFITKIQAVDASGQSSYLLPMNFNIVSSK